jgi:hypothetical protein
VRGGKQTLTPSGGSYDLLMRKSAALVLLVTLTSGCSDTCQNSTISTAGAPTGNMKAVLFQRDCSATTAFSSHVSLANMDEVSSGKATFLSPAPTTAQHASWGGPWVELRWLSPRNLLVRYDAKAQVFTQSESVSGVKVSYEKVMR